MFKQKHGLREQGLHNLQEKIEAFNAADAAEVTELEQKIAAVDSAVKALVIPDVSGFVTEADYNVGQHAQNKRIAALETAAPDYALLMSRSEVESELDTLEQSNQYTSFCCSSTRSSRTNS